MPRIIPLETIRNFRDFGGYKISSGTTVKAGKLYRSAHFSDTSDEDQAFLDEIGLGLRVDLRYAPERTRQPNRAGQASLRELTYPDGDGKAELYAPHEMFLKENLEKPQDARDYMTGSYRTRVDDAGFIEVFRETLLYMAERTDPLVIHCAAGKDRTGTLGAIILKTLGASDEDVMEDYMLTMTAVDIESYLEPASQMMSKRFDRTISPAALRPMFGVEPGYLEASLTAMGDFETYLKKMLGISSAQQDLIRKNFLA